MNEIMERIWYGNHPIKWLLWPLSLIYILVVSIRKLVLVYYAQTRFPIPVIVVGNLTVGGVGKTPLVIEMVRQFQRRGKKVAVVSRGYKARIKAFPHEIKHSDRAEDVGDEPYLISERALCPVVIDPNRVQAVEYLIKRHQPDIIISDDGLQHYRMGRSVEIAVIDGVRGFGNRMCLPAGPMREPKSRLKEVDFTLVTEGFWRGFHSMSIKPVALVNLVTGEEIKPEDITTQVIAIAGIGNPQRFYSTLTKMGIKYKAVSFPDHYPFHDADFEPYNDQTIIMTEKDAVKCRPFCNDRMYYLKITASVNDVFWHELFALTDSR